MQTQELIVRSQQGDAPAREQLYRRYHDRLTAWAHGRLPKNSRTIYETQDLVQMAFERSLTHLEGFESRFDGAFGAYLRHIVANLVKDIARREARRPQSVELGDQHEAKGPSPLDMTIGHELLENYERALERLTPQQSAAVVLRVELGLTYAEIAEELKLPSERAAYMRVSRGVRRLAEVLGEGRASRGGKE